VSARRRPRTAADLVAAVRSAAAALDLRVEETGRRDGPALDLVGRYPDA
jgi:hypothetical protein